LPKVQCIQTGDLSSHETKHKVYRLLDVKQSTTIPYHAIQNAIVENLNKTIKNLLKNAAAEKPKVGKKVMYN